MGIQEKINELRELYESRKTTFDDFSNTISGILKKLLNEHSFQYQVVSRRVKTFQSIKEKVERGILPENINLNDIDDVAGCRIIFYLESDIQNFANLLYREVNVEKNNLRYSNDGYNALHLVVKLFEDRLNNMGKEQFNGLKCEIQLTTVLFHAWSEMSHNIIYKLPEDLSVFDKKTVDFLKNEFGEVMKNHIKPASYSFEFINERFENLKQGKKIFDIEFLHNILKSNSRNEIYEKLKLFHQYFNDFGDKTPNNFNLIEFISGVIHRSKTLKANEIKNSLGSMYSFEHHHVVEVCLDILNLIRYKNIKETLNILVELILDDNFKIRQKTFQILNNLSSYNKKVIEMIGYSPQMQILTIIEELSQEDKLKYWDIIESAFINLVKFDYNDSSLVSYNQIVIESGTIGSNENLVAIRKKVIKLLIELYATSNKKTNIAILKVLMESTNLPERGNFENKIEETVIDNISEIIEWSVSQYHQLNLQEIKLLDKNIFRISKESPNLKNSEKLKWLEASIEKNIKYNIYKIFVGYDLSFKKELGWREVREIRRNKINEYLMEIVPENYIFWEEIILEIAGCYSSKEEGEFWYFKTFLFEVGKTKSDFAKFLLLRNEDNLKNFLSNLLGGLMSNDSETEYAEQIVLGWVTDQKYLFQSAGVYIISEYLNIKILEKIFENAKGNKDVDAIFNVFRVIINTNNYCRQLTSLFMKVISELSRNNQFYWTHYIWFEEGSILKVLEENDYDNILNCLEDFPSIEVHEQELLKPIANEHSKKIIYFFEKRVKNEIQKQKEGFNRLIGRYDAIPYNFYDLHTILIYKSEIILPLVMEWFNKSDVLFQWEASQLIKNLFPKFNEPLQNHLNVLISKGCKEDAMKVLRIIKEYNGSPETYNVCKNLVKNFFADKHLMNQLMHAITQTNVVSGEYGFVETYKGIKKEIRKWQNTKNKEIKGFVKEFIKFIDAIIVQETKRADNNKEMMIRRFNR